ncbi:hypothetical protein ACU6Z2_12710 [Klebsiella aerogenes]
MRLLTNLNCIPNVYLVYLPGNMRANELSTPVEQILTDIAILLKPNKFDPMTVELTYTIVATDYALKAIIVPLMAKLKHRAPYIKIAVRS